MKVTCPSCNASADVEVKPGGAVLCSCGNKFFAPRSYNKPWAVASSDVQEGTPMTIVDVRMPFRRMVVLFIKVWAASIVAFLTVISIPAILGILAGILSPLFRATP